MTTYWIRSAARRTALPLLVVVAGLLTLGCEELGITEKPSSPPPPAGSGRALALVATTTPTAAPTKAATAAATAAPPKATATAPALAGAPKTGGRVALGYDHPPYSRDWQVSGGNSIGIVCGAMTGVPGGTVLVIELGGGTGQPPSVNATVGPDGTFITPFPIQEYGPITVGSIVPASTTAPIPISVSPFDVGPGADVACTP